MSFFGLLAPSEVYNSKTGSLSKASQNISRQLSITVLEQLLNSFANYIEHLQKNI